MANVTISHVTKSFGDVEVLKEFNEVFEDKEFITLLGPSGCGKTTMLRMIAGFEKPTTGEIRIGEQVVSSQNTFVPPERRDIGMVFQSYAVWPHMTVFENVAYPLKIKRMNAATVKEKVDRILDVVHLSQYADRIPSQLSGGQQQRVALGRALVAEPRLLLLDEPLTSFDVVVADEMKALLRRIKTRHIILLSTHIMDLALDLCDDIVILHHGVLQEVRREDLADEAYKDRIIAALKEEPDVV